MPDMVVLYLDADRVRGVEAQVQKSKIQLRRSFSVAAPEGVDLRAEPDKAAAWLRQQLTANGVRTRQVTAVLAREDLAVRRMDLPPAPDEQLANMVRLQAATAMAGMERMQLDFIPLPRQDATAGRSVLTMAVRKDRLERLKTLFMDAGLQLLSVRVSSVALAEMAARAESARGASADEPSLAMLVDGQRVEIAVMYRRALVMVHVVETDSDDGQQDQRRVAAEALRLLVACQKALEGKKLARVWLAGASTSSPLATELHTRLGCEVLELAALGSDVDDSELDVENLSPSAMAICIGTLWASGSQTVPRIDLLNPRQPPVPKNNKRLRLIVGGVAAAMLLVIPVTLIKLRERDIQRTIDQHRQSILDLNQVVDRGKPVTAAAAVLDEWELRRVDWLTELRKFKQLLPPPDKMYLANLRIEPAQQRAVARIKATGFARQRDDIEAFYQTLSENGYRVLPQTINYNDADQTYRHRFELNFEIPLAGAEAAESATPGAPVTRPTAFSPMGTR